MALAMSSKHNHSLDKPSYGRNATTIIKHAEVCHVYEGPSVVNNNFLHKATNEGSQNNVQDEAEDFVNPKAKRLKPVYVETRGFVESLDILDNDHALFITGNPGTGKTSMAVMVTKKLMKKGFKPIMVRTPKDWNQVIRSAENGKTVAFVDDIFGTISVEESKVNKWLERNQVIYDKITSMNGNLKIICTLRKKIYVESLRRLERFDWYRTFRVVDLSSIHEMNNTEKRELMKKYFEHFKIPQELRCYKAVELDTIHGFPHCVELYCTEPNCRRNGLNFFKTPVCIVKREMQILLEMRSIEFYVLLLVLLSPNQRLDDTALATLELGEALLNRTRALSLIPTSDPADIVNAIRKLTGVYFEEFDDGSIGFKHESLSEIIALIAIRHNPTPAVNSLSMLLLSEKTKYISYKGDDQNEYEILPKKCTKHLVKRITQALLNDEAHSACKHHGWEDINFVTGWLSYVKETKSEKNGYQALLDELMREPLETYTVKNNGIVEVVSVGFLFLLYLNKKQAARAAVIGAYKNPFRVENLNLSAKFMLGNSLHVGDP